MVQGIPVARVIEVQPRKEEKQEPKKKGGKKK